MHNIQIPKELKKAISRKIAIRLLLFALLLALNLIIVIRWWGDLFPIEKINSVAKYSFAIIFLILPFFLTKVYKIFTDTAYTGIVRNVKIRSVVDSKSTVKVSQEMLYRKNEVYLTVETPNGKIIQKKCMKDRRSMRQIWKNIGSGIKSYICTALVLQSCYLLPMIRIAVVLFAAGSMKSPMICAYIAESR